MKRILKCLSVLLSVAAILFTVGCEQPIAYQMGECETDGLIYSVPLHFALSEDEDADAYYITVNSAVAVYTYLYNEFCEIFDGYNGDYTALDIAQHIVDLRAYNCRVYEGTIEGSAGYSFLYTDYDQTYYSVSSVLVSDERVYVITFSCFADKLERYQDMISEIMNSVRFAEE